MTKTHTDSLETDGLFMASVVAIMVCDYFLLVRGNVFLSHLYNGSRENNHYYFIKGWNVQAYIAYICGIALPFPGFVGTLGPTVSASAENLGHLGWMLSFTVSFVVYWALCTVWPTMNQKRVKELGLGFEEMADKEVVAMDGTVIPESLEGYTEERSVGMYDENVEKGGAAVNTGYES